MKRLAFLLVLIALAPAAASRSAQPLFINAVVENYAAQSGPPVPMKQVLIEYDNGGSVQLKETPGTGFRQVITVDHTQPRAANITAMREGRRIMLPIWIRASTQSIDFTIVDGNEPECDVPTRRYIAEYQDSFRLKLDAYFIARRLLEQGVCDTRANRFRVEELYFARSCDLSRMNENIRIDPKAINRLRWQNKASMTAMADRALHRCAYRRSGAY